MRTPPVVAAVVQDEAANFLREFRALVKKHGIADDALASFCAGVVVDLCQGRKEDPIEFMRWALQATQPPPPGKYSDGEDTVTVVKVEGDTVHFKDEAGLSYTGTIALFNSNFKPIASAAA